MIKYLRRFLVWVYLSITTEHPEKTHVLRIITTSCLTFFCSYTKSSELLCSDTLAGSSLSTYTIARIWSTFSAWIFTHDTRKSLQLSVHTPDPGGIARHFRSIWLVFTRHWSNNKRYTWRSWSPRSIWRYSWRHIRYSQCFQMPKTRRKEVHWTWFHKFFKQVLPVTYSPEICLRKDTIIGCFDHQ